MHKKNILLYLTLFLLLACSKFKDPSPNYTYRIPDTGNELSVSSLETEGMNIGIITQMTNRLIRDEYKRIHSVLILKNNKLVYEEYFNGHTEAIPQNIYSATKSITSILVGIAIDKGFINSVDETVMSFFPEYIQLPTTDPRKEQITIQHLLNMSSGLDCEDWYQHTEADMIQSDDWVKFTLDLPMVNDPGTEGSYCTGGVVILGRIIEKKSGMRLDRFAEKYLFTPLNIKEYEWRETEDGISGGGRGLYLRPRDMAKIGQLMLQNGVWNGDQIVSQSWVETSGENLIPLPGPFTGYGYLWWKQTFLTTPSTDVYFASGNGGQEIFVIPSHNMVLVFTGGNLNTSLGLQNIYMIRDYILPSIQ